MTAKHLIIDRKIDHILLQRARELRGEMTLTEKWLWSALRRYRLGDFHFRRQQIIGRYIVDSYCDTASQVIEADGSVHAQRVE